MPPSWPARVFRDSAAKDAGLADRLHQAAPSAWSARTTRCACRARRCRAQIDYESELAVVIGRGGRDIPRARAMDHVFGYTIVNDVTARDVQVRHQQWDLGKSFDTFCPMGPWIVTADELDGRDTRVRGWVNGELRQDGRTTRHDLRHPDADRDLLARHHAATPATSSPPARRPASAWASTPPTWLQRRRRGAHRDRRHRRDREPLRVRLTRMALHLIDRMAVEDEGEGDAVVCVHGLGGSANTLTPLMPALARHRVLRIDLPGSGRSQRAEGPLSIAALRRRGAVGLRAAGRRRARTSSAIRSAPSSASTWRWRRRSWCAAWRCSAR